MIHTEDKHQMKLKSELLAIALFSKYDNILLKARKQLWPTYREETPFSPCHHSNKEPLPRSEDAP